MHTQRSFDYAGFSPCIGATRPLVPIVITSLYFLTLLPFAAFFGIAVYMAIAPVYDKLSAVAFIEFFQKPDPRLSFHRLHGAFEAAGFLCLLTAAFFHASQT